MSRHCRSINLLHSVSATAVHPFVTQGNPALNPVLDLTLKPTNTAAYQWDGARKPALTDELIDC